MKSVAAVLALCSVASGVSADSLQEHDFILNCAGCHTLSGAGSATVPSLRGMSAVAASPGARSYFVRVPGVAQAPLSDERLAALVNWLVERFVGTTAWPSYTAAEVRVLRADPFLDPLGARARLTPTAAAAPKEPD